MKLAQWGDVAAIPFFALLCIYFYGIEEKTDWLDRRPILYII